MQALYFLFTAPLTTVLCSGSSLPYHSSLLPSIKAEQSQCVTTELKQTARSCASTWGGQSDDCYVVSTAG